MEVHALYEILINRHDAAAVSNSSKSTFVRAKVILTLCGVTLFALLVLNAALNSYVANTNYMWVDPKNGGVNVPKSKIRDIVEAEHGVVASDDERCSNIGVDVLREGGHAVDAAVATALCLGVVNPASSGIGGGAFMMLLLSSPRNHAYAFDMRETAPLKASQDMYAENPSAKSRGPLSIAVPGELAGLHAAWTQHGKLPWKRLVQPALELAVKGFTISSFLGSSIQSHKDAILADIGLRGIFSRNGTLLSSGDTCYNPRLGETLQAISDFGASVFYNGSVGQKLVSDIQAAGGIISAEDLQNYRVKISPPVSSSSMGYTILGMPPPSSAVGLNFILNVLASYGKEKAASDLVAFQRMIEIFKHMFAIRTGLGDPDYVNVTDTVAAMLSPDFAAEIRKRILDNATFPPAYYEYRWNPLRDHGTSHFAIVDADRNALAMTTSVNFVFGSQIVSASTGILLNNEMDDFSTPTETSPDHLPPAPANFIQPGKRPLSSMAPTIVLKNQQLVGILGASGGMHIIPTVAQVYVHHFLNALDPLSSVVAPRIFHQLLPDFVEYENFTTVAGDRIEFSKDVISGLIKIGHHVKELRSFRSESSIIVQDFQKLINSVKRKNMYGMLTAVGDPRKNAIPAGY